MTVNRPSVDRVNRFLGIQDGRSATAEGRARGSGLLAADATGRLALTTNRASWNHLNTSQLRGVQANFRHAVHHSGTSASMHNWLESHPARGDYWNHWAGGIRTAWHPHGYYGCFTPRFWATNHIYFPWRHHYYWWGGYRPWWYWWTYPSWNTCAGWYANWGWNTPCYYDYGVGGNIYYSDGYVYANGQQVGTAADYAQSAADLAATGPSPEVADKPGEWLALGTFAIATSEEDKDPARVIQLAVDKEGNVSGTMTNKETNKTYPVQGRVDKETQRVAFSIGDNKDVVLETGMYNLTQQETPVLVHQGPERTETYVLLRVELPEDQRKEARGESSLLP